MAVKCKLKSVGGTSVIRQGRRGRCGRKGKKILEVIMSIRVLAFLERQGNASKCDLGI